MLSKNLDFNFQIGRKIWKMEKSEYEVANLSFWHANLPGKILDKRKNLHLAS